MFYCTHGMAAACRLAGYQCTHGSPGCSFSDTHEALAFNQLHPGPKGTCLHTQQLHIQLQSGTPRNFTNSLLSVPLQHLQSCLLCMHGSGCIKNCDYSAYKDMHHVIKPYHIYLENLQHMRNECNAYNERKTTSYQVSYQLWWQNGFPCSAYSHTLTSLHSLQKKTQSMLCCHVILVTV